MKKTLFRLFFSFIFISGFAMDFTDTEKTAAISGITEAQSPIIRERTVVFTASPKARWTGIAFAHEEYKEIHNFERVNLRGDEDEIVSSFLFFVYEIPEPLMEVEYRLVVDGLWTTDPLNKNSRYDQRLGINSSLITVNTPPAKRTEQLSDGRVRFIFSGNSGEHVTLAGSFNNWDPYMYYLQEVSPGVYTITLPISAGTQYYVFYVGAIRTVDKTNSNRGYTPDGKYVSVLEVE